jgi:hypothetical protein
MLPLIKPQGIWPKTGVQRSERGIYRGETENWNQEDNC